MRQARFTLPASLVTRFYFMATLMRVRSIFKKGQVVAPMSTKTEQAALYLMAYYCSKLYAMDWSDVTSKRNPDRSMTLTFDLRN